MSHSKTKQTHITYMYIQLQMKNKNEKCGVSGIPIV